MKKRIKKSIKRKLARSYGSLLLLFILIFISFNTLLVLELKAQGIDLWMMESNASIFHNIEGLIAKSVRDHIKLENEKLISMAGMYSDLAAEGIITHDEALAKVISKISHQKIGESGYSYAVNSRGIMVAHPVKQFIGKDFSNDPIVGNQHQKGEGFLDYQWQNPGEKVKRNKTLYLTTYKPLDLVISTTAYVDDPTISSIRIEDVRQFLLNSPGIENSNTSLLNGEGTFLIKPEGIKDLPDKNVLITPYLNIIKKSGHGKFTIPSSRFPGILYNRIVYYQYLSGIDWIIATCGNVGEIYSLLINIIVISLVVAAASVILLISLNNLISHRFSGPLIKLVNTLDQGSAGDHSARSDLKTGDEFEVLGSHFNTFMDAQQRFLDEQEAAQKSIKLLARFPDENPSPILRIDGDGILEYANANAVQWILPALNLSLGKTVPDGILDLMIRQDNLIGRNEISVGDHIFSFSTSRMTEPDSLYLYGRDITRQKKFESLQLLSENIFRNSIEGIVITNGKGVIESINPAFSSITGYSEKDAIGKNPSILRSHKHSPDFYKRMWEQLLVKGYWDGEIWNRRKNGTVYPEYLTITSLRDNYGDIQHFISFFHDLSEVQEKEERIEYEATHDSLTGLPNKDYLYRKIQQRISDSQEKGFSILYVDIRNLNRINESLGTDAGDAVLIESARRLKELCREGMTAARLGSDDFALLLPQKSSSPELQTALNEILNVFHSVFLVKGKDVDIRVSMGLSVYPDDDRDPKELVAKAEMAMRSSKDNVNSFYQFYTPRMLSPGLSRLELESSLRRGIEEKLFYLNYQPKVNARTGLIIGSEALVRMEPVDGHLIGPDLFIPVAEEIGLIEALGAWVLEQACRDTRYLHSQGFENLSVAVNLSPWQFRRRDLPQQVENIVESTGLRMECLNLEITEGMAINNVGKSLEMMKQLTALGLSLSIDDFGTGYSSLSYLVDFPVDVLKIDKSFVNGIPFDNKITGVALAIISLARNLGMETVAEGVETREQLDFFIEKGCETIQGYYFHKPMRLEEYESALRNQ